MALRTRCARDPRRSRRERDALHGPPRQADAASEGAAEPCRRRRWRSRDDVARPFRRAARTTLTAQPERVRRPPARAQPSRADDDDGAAETTPRGRSGERRKAGLHGVGASWGSTAGDRARDRYPKGRDAFLRLGRAAIEPGRPSSGRRARAIVRLRSNRHRKLQTTTPDRRRSDPKPMFVATNQTSSGLRTTPAAAVRSCAIARRRRGARYPRSRPRATQQQRPRA